MPRKDIVKCCHIVGRHNTNSLSSKVPQNLGHVVCGEFSVDSRTEDREPNGEPRPDTRCEGQGVRQRAEKPALIAMCDNVSADVDNGEGFGADRVGQGSELIG